MYAIRGRAPRLLSSFLILVLVMTMLVSAAPQSASAVVQKQTVFASNFNGLATGPIAPPTEVAVELGRIYAETATVEVVPSSVTGGKALAVSGGTGEADLRFAAYPNGLPPVNGSDPNINGNDRYDLVVYATLTASISDTLGAEFGLEVDPDTFFEFFTFDANGQLSRDGAPITSGSGISGTGTLTGTTPMSATYEVSSTVQLEARVHLALNTVDISIVSNGQMTRLTGIALPGGFTRATMNRLSYRAQGGTGVYTIDNVQVGIERQREAAAIIILPPPVVQIEFENGIPFLIVFLNFSNSGGLASYVFLTIDLDDLLELADLSFLEGAGYVVHIKGKKVEIGIGVNNVLDMNEGVKMKLKFKASKKGKVKVKFTFEYNDSTGLVVMDPLEVDQDLEGAAPTTPPATPPAAGTYARLPLERIDVRFTGRWNSGGGLRIYGFPLTEPMVLSGGMIVQYFERARFEYHPEYAGTQYEVLLGLLGVELGFLQPPVAAPTSTSTISGTWYFVPTGHYIAPAFRLFWETRGGLYTFGYPIGEAFIDSNGRIVQYFERTRLEYHPEYVGTEYEVLLGFLGEDALRKQGGAAR